MKKILMGVTAIAVMGLGFSFLASLRHGHHTAVTAHTSAAAIVKRSSTGAPFEKNTGMAEESETADVPMGLSPIATAAAGTLPAVAAPIPSKWIDGKNYTTLVPAQPTSVAPDKVEAVEVFWYHCPHCNQFDPALENWRQKNKAAYVDFLRVPVVWDGNPITKADARLFYTLVALGKLEQLHPVVFREIHVKNNPMADPRDPAATERMHKAFLMANGVSAADFDKTYHSFSVESRLQRAEELTRRYKVTGVPYFVVNGRYSADVGTAGGEPQLLSLMDDLAAAEHKR